LTDKAGKIVAIGNALVDVITHIPETFLEQNSLRKGSMELMDHNEASRIYDLCPPAQEASGGSSANTAAIAAALGSPTTFIGKVADDQLGNIFKHDMTAQGVCFETSPLDPEINKTGMCLSLLTPDHQRTMCTALGGAQHLEPGDIPIQDIRDAEIVFLESYILDSPSGYEVFQHVADHTEGRIALTLSDSMCVSRHHKFLSGFISARNVHYIFGNAEEIASLYGCYTIEENLAKAGNDVAMTICTDGPNGVYIHRARRLTHFPASPARVVDTTGAGDSFAGAFLCAITSGYTVKEAANTALAVAAEIIGTIGARPTRDISGLMRKSTENVSRDFATQA
jgi:sugar/nucleoside kinase (ribokinase family)